jgi:hypothetical protein
MCSLWTRLYSLDDMIREIAPADHTKWLVDECELKLEANAGCKDRQKSFLLLAILLPDLSCRSRSQGIGHPQLERA